MQARHFGPIIAVLKTWSYAATPPVATSCISSTSSSTFYPSFCSSSAPCPRALHPTSPLPSSCSLLFPLLLPLCNIQLLVFFALPPSFAWSMSENNVRLSARHGEKMQITNKHIVFTKTITQILDKKLQGSIFSIQRNSKKS